MARMRAFYVEFLGMAVEWEPDPDNLYLTSGPDNLALHRAERPAGPGALDHLGFMVTRPDVVDLWFRRAQDAGLTIVQAPKDHRDGARSFYLEDPDGNRVQIIHHRPLEALPASEDPRSRG
ncbi:MAG: VOC family protein [Planctomycetes bacterium]|nr:VOC family protein [Planctomycetota bacterium]